MNMFNCVLTLFVPVCVCVYLYEEQECPFPIQHVYIRSRGLSSPPLHHMPLSPSSSLYNTPPNLPAFPSRRPEFSLTE